LSKKEKGRTVSDVVRTVQLEEVEAKSAEVGAWIESKLKEKLKKGLRESLVDGVVLCKLANSIKPGCIAKYHRQPKLLMMKMENIGFFLTTCKTRFQVPSPMLFQPTDLHDDADVASMRKVLNVLIFLKHEVCGEGGPSSASYSTHYAGGEEDEEEDNNDEDKNTELEVQPPPHNPPAEVPPPEDPDSSSEDQEPIIPETPDHTAHYHDVTPVVTNGGALEIETEWYLEGKRSGVYAEIQNEILKTITSTIHSELSLESKIKLISNLQGHINAVQNKIMNSTDDELHTLAHQMGLGKKLSDLPSKDREWYLEFLLKYGRVQ